MWKRMTAGILIAVTAFGISACGIEERMAQTSLEGTTLSSASAELEAEIPEAESAAVIDVEPISEDENEKVNSDEDLTESVTASSDTDDSDAAYERIELPEEDPDEIDVVPEKEEERTSNSVEVSELLQMPELPTGCESVALTIVLQYLGFELEKTEIAEEYLVYGDNYATAYVGSPFSTSGAGAFPVAIVRTANRYLRKQKSQLRAKNITGSNLEKLYDYIDEGTPVLVWHTMYMGEPGFTGDQREYDGNIYRWYSLEHCVVLYGYDKEAGTVLISDPLEGLVERDAEAFERIYELCGEYAVVIE